jgi:hypothetical protein
MNGAPTLRSNGRVPLLGRPAGAATPIGLAMNRTRCPSSTATAAFSWRTCSSPVSPTPRLRLTDTLPSVSPCQPVQSGCVIASRDDRSAIGDDAWFQNVGGEPLFGLTTRSHLLRVPSRDYKAPLDNFARRVRESLREGSVHDVANVLERPNSCRTLHRDAREAIRAAGSSRSALDEYSPVHVRLPKECNDEPNT